MLKALSVSITQSLLKFGAARFHIPAAALDYFFASSNIGRGAETRLPYPAELIAVGNTHHVLLDDRAIIQHIGHVMTGRADELDTALECPVIRFRPAECR